MSRVQLYFRPQVLSDAPANRGFDVETVRSLLGLLELGGVRVEWVDTTTLSDEELWTNYLHAITAPAASKKHRFRQIFGSKRYPGRLFGREVPALMVYEDGANYPSDVYPHQESGRLVTIRDFLERETEKKAIRSDALHAAARMDERRARVGSIGFRAAELIREGRHR